MTRRRASIAKTSVPRLFNVVPRERLFAALDKNRGRPLIWIEGPPGSGKTSLVASYLEARGLPTFWYQVDAGDADPAKVFEYLSRAVDLPGPMDLPTLPRLVSEHLSDVPAFARMYFREFFERLPQGIVLVLDNCQEATGALHEIAMVAATEVPSPGSILCVSRNPPALAYAPFAARGVLFRLQPNELELTVDETRSIAAARGLHEDWLIQALHAYASGWVAGITLMLERLGHVDEERRELPQGASASVFDYFAMLLFDQAQPHVQETLLAVAPLPYVTPAMAHHLTGDADAGRILEDLFRRHLFTHRRGGGEPVYQFHDLFRDFLRARLRERWSVLDIRARLCRCAELLEASDEIETAAELWIEAGEWSQVERLVVRNASDLLHRGRRQTLEAWIGAIPGELTLERPWLSYWLGVAQAETYPEQGVETLRCTLEQFRRGEDVEGQMQCLTDLLRIAFLGYNAVESMERWLDELLHHLQSQHRFRSVDDELEVWGVLCSALLWVKPWHRWTSLATERVETLLTHATDPVVILAAATNALSTCAISGDFERGERLLAATSHLQETPGVSPSDAAWWCARGAGHLRFLQADYDGALRWMQRGCDIADRHGMRETFTMTIYSRYMVEFRVARHGISDATMTEMLALPRPRSAVGEAMFYVYQARQAQLRGQRAAAADFAELTQRAIERTGSPYQELLFGLVDAELLVDAGRFDRVPALIERARELVDRCPIFDQFRGVVPLCESLLALAKGDRLCASELLKQALALSQHGNRRCVLRFYEVCMRRLFVLALEEDIEPDFVRELILEFRLLPPPEAPDSWPHPVEIRTLGRFEIDVRGTMLEFNRKTPKKMLALLKALIAHGGQHVPEHWLCDALWSDEETDDARQVLGVTVLRLRKLLGREDAVLQQGGRVWLDRQVCGVDAWRFESRMIASGNGHQWLRAIEGYAGSFLPDDEEEAWSVATRERLRGKFIHGLASVGEALEAHGQMEAAAALYLRGIDADVIVEAFHRGLMRCYLGTGRLNEAVSVYRRLRQTLSVVLSVAPAAETVDLHQRILAELASTRTSPSDFPDTNLRRSSGAHALALTRARE